MADKIWEYIVKSKLDFFFAHEPTSYILYILRTEEENLESISIIMKWKKYWIPSQYDIFSMKWLKREELKTLQLYLNILKKQKQEEKTTQSSGVYSIVLPYFLGVNTTATINRCHAITKELATDLCLKLGRGCARPIYC